MKKPLNLSPLQFDFKLDEQNHLESYQVSYSGDPKPEDIDEQIESCQKILEDLKGKELSELIPLLTASSKEAKLNFVLMKMIVQLQELQAPLNFSAYGNEELICRCMGVQKKTIISLMNNLSEESLKVEQDTLRALANETSLGSACGTCLPEAKRMLPSLNKKEQALFQSKGISPLEYQIKAGKLVKKLCDASQLKGYMKRGKGRTIFLSFQEKPSLNITDFERKISEELESSTGITPQLFFDFI